MTTIIFPRAPHNVIEAAYAWAERNHQVFSTTLGCVRAYLDAKKLQAA